MQRTAIEASAVNIIISLIGVLLIAIGFLIPSGDTRNILLSVGCSLIASAVVTFLSSKYLIRSSRIKNMIEYWGIEGIYQTRQEMNRSTDTAFIPMEKNLDIIAWGLKSFRDAKTGIIKEKVARGLKIRIIAPHPESPFVAQREKDENEVPGQIKKTIIDLGKWVDDLKSDKVQIRYYKSLPEDFYFRVDDHVYLGPYQYGISSQQTISYEFIGPSQGFKMYTEYFDKIWNNESFCS